MAQRRVQGVHLGEGVVALEPAADGIRQVEYLPGVQHADLLLLGEVLGRIEAVFHSQVEERRCRFGQSNAAGRGTQRIGNDHLDHLLRA